MPRHWLTIAVMITLIAGGIFLLDSPPEVFQPDTALTDPADAQLAAYLTGVSTRQYNQSGALDYNFTAERMSHFQPDADTASTDDYTIISKPFFTFHQENNSPWYLQAEEGRSIQNDELLILQDNVRAWQNNENQEPTVISTSELLIRPETQVAETDQFVMISRPQVATRGVGMRADLEQETFAILSEGKTTYEPNP